MAGNVDQRIIQMQFDNRQFEKNIAKSQKSIEDLKQAMDFEETSKGLKNFAESTHALKFDGLAENVEKLMNKFTGLGTVSEYVLSRIRSMAEGAALSMERFIKSISVGQISVGMSKYDQLNKAVMTIVSGGIASEEEAYGVMQRVATYTDQTSHSFETMVSKISDLTSRGMGLDEAERLIEAIGNAATYAGQGANEAAMSMNVLSKVLGGQFMGYEQYLQLANTSKVITAKWKEQAIEAGLAVGTLVEKQGKYYTQVKGQKAVEVSVQNIEDTLRQRWLTSDVAKKIYENYEFGDTLSDLEHPEKAVIKGMDNAKEEIGKKMQEMFPDSNVDLLNRKIVKMGDDIATVLTETFTASKNGKEGLQWNQDLVMNITPITPDGKKLDDNEVQKYVEDLLKKSKNVKELLANDKKANGGKGLVISATTDFKSFEEGIKTAESSAEELHKLQEEYYKDAEKTNSINTEFGKTAFLTGQRALTLKDALNAIKESVSSGWMKTFRLIFGDVSEAAEHFTAICDRVLESLGKIRDFRNEVLEIWANAGGRKNLFSLLLGDYEDGVKSGVVGLLDIIDDFGKLVENALIDFLSLFADPVERANFKLHPGHFKAWLAKQLELLVEGAQNFMGRIKNFFNERVEIGGQVKTRLDAIHEVVKGIAGALKIAYDIVHEVIAFIGEIGGQMTPGFDAILGFLGKLGEEIYKTAEETGDAGTIRQFFKDLGETMKPITEGLNELIISITNFLSMLLGLDDDNKDRTKTFERIGKVLLTIAEIVAKVSGPILTFLASALNAITNLFSGGFSAEKFAQFGKDLSEGFKTMMNSFADNLPDSLGFLKDWIHGLFGQGATDITNEATGLFGLIGNLTKQGEKTKNDAEKSAGKSKGGGFLSIFTGTNILAWGGVAGIVAVIALINKARKAVGSIGEFFGDLGDALKNGFKFNREQGENGTDRFNKIAKSLALIAASITVLGLIPTNALIQGGIAIAAIVGIMLLTMWLLKKVSKGMDFKQQVAMTAQLFVIAAGAAMLGVAVGILALALLPLSKMSLQGLAQAIGGLGAVLMEIIFAMWLVKQVKGDDKAAPKLKSFIGFALSAAILMFAMRPFANMSINGFYKAIGGLGAVLMEIILAMALVKKVQGDDEAAPKLRSFVGFALSVAILMYAMRPLANLKLKEMWMMLGSLGGVLMELVLFMALVKKVQGDDEKAPKLAGFIGFAVAMAVLVLAIQPLANLKLNEMWTMLGSLGGILMELVLFMAMVKKVQGDDKATPKLNSFIGFAAAMALLVWAIRPLADMQMEQMWMMLGSLGGILMELVLFMAMVKKVQGDDKASPKLNSFIGFAAAMALLVWAIQPLANLKIEQLWMMLGSLGGILMELVLFMALVKKVQGDDKSSPKLTGFILFAFSIKLLIDAVSRFKDMNINQLYMILGGLGGVLMELVLFMALMKKADVGNVKVIGLAGLAGGLSMLLNAMKPILDLPADDWQPVVKALVALGGVLLMMVGFMYLIKKIKLKKLTTQMGQLAIVAVIISAVMIAFAVALKLVENVKWETILSFAAGLAIVVGVFGLVGGLIGKIPGGPTAVIKGMTALAAGIAILIGVLAVMIPLLITNIASGVSDAMGQLVLIGDMFGMFIGSVNSIGDGELNKTIDIFTDLMTFVGSFTGFSVQNAGISNFYNALFQLGVGVKSFHERTSDLGDMSKNQGLVFIKSLAGCADDLRTIEKMGIRTFLQNIAGLGGAMMIYAQGAKEAAALTGAAELTGDNIPDVSAAVLLLQEISKALAEAGGFTIPEEMPDDSVLSGFGTSLAALAGGFKVFEEAGLSLGEGYKEGKKALEFFRDLKADLEYYNFNDNLIAVQDQFKNGEELIQPDVLITLGGDIEALGEAMAKFANCTTVTNQETQEITPLDFSKAIEALDTFVQFQERLAKFKIGGFLNGILFGSDMNLGQLSGQIVQLGAGLNELCAAVTGEGPLAQQHNYTGISDQAVKTADDVTRRMIDLMDILKHRLPSIGGLGNWISTIFSGRDYTFTDLSTQLQQLGTGLGELGKGINTGNWASAEATKNAFDALDSVVEMMVDFQAFSTTMNQLENFTGITGYDIFTHLNDLLKFLTQGVTDEGYETPPALDILMETIQKIDQAMVEYTKTADSMENMQGRVGIFKTFAEGLNYLSNSNMAVDWSSIGSKMIWEIAKAIDDGVTNVTDAMRRAMEATYAQGNNVEGLSWATLGENIASGIAQGMTDNNSMLVLTSAASTMVWAAFLAACNKAESASPSQLFAELGVYCSEGLGVGITDGAGEAADAAEKMVDTVANPVEAMAEGMNRPDLRRKIVQNLTDMAIQMNEKLGAIMSGKGVDTSMLDGVRDRLTALSNTFSGSDLSFEPTITPVLDLTQVEAGLNSAFGANAQNRYTIGLDTSLGAAIAGALAQNEQPTYDFNQLKPDYSGLYAKMDALGQQVNSLGKAIGNIKIILNSGVVAGGVTDDVDRNLGRKIFYAGRNN